MSFQAYLRTIEEKTGRDPQGLRDWARAKGLLEGERLKPSAKAGDVLAPAKAELGLGHGHAMAVYALLSGKRHEGNA
ncbi:MAG: hypothetical protein AVDCRST_MAG09-1159 [uncultured Sphingomonas sp.]|uniref:DUF4287 domain-containing protein n=1 Tax=uncultured Sphingomonas sp. TaxID=158754 RepID=A0A6J4SWS7_9SPHN|nr:DUF4287 domain-containing protein [uncultured Sphingomonas sp.]CAA9507755.1 MAG: hypothetical protein AVDCRST_MAG09-1159 [uncultured Sphingomonas sp.]